MEEDQTSIEPLHFQQNIPIFFPNCGHSIFQDLNYPYYNTPQYPQNLTNVSYCHYCYIHYQYFLNPIKSSNTYYYQPVFTENGSLDLNFPNEQNINADLLNLDKKPEINEKMDKKSSQESSELISFENNQSKQSIKSEPQVFTFDKKDCLQSQSKIQKLIDQNNLERVNFEELSLKMIKKIAHEKNEEKIKEKNKILSSEKLSHMEKMEVLFHGYEKIHIEHQEKIIKFQPLFDLLLNVFAKSVFIEKDFEQLIPFERELFIFLIKRKFILGQPAIADRKFHNPTFSRIKTVIETSVPKKPEDYYKFIITRFFSFNREKAEKKSGGKITTEDLYQIYFGDVSKEFDIPLTHFYYPLTKNLKGKVNFNYSYFYQIFKSEMFIKEMNVFFHKEITEYHFQEIFKKLSVLILRWEKAFMLNEWSKKVSNKALFAEITSLNRYNVPWTREEMIDSIYKFKKLIQVCTEKNQ